MRGRRWFVSFSWDDSAFMYGPVPVWAPSEESAAAEGVVLCARELPRRSFPERVTVERTLRPWGDR